MKTYKVFEAEELEAALDEADLKANELYHLFEGVGNDTAVCWWINSEDKDENEYGEVENIINTYMISQGCSPNETVMIYFSW